MRLKRGDTGNIRIQFVSAGELTTLPAGANVELGIKPLGEYDTDFLAFAENFTEPVSPATEYIQELGLNVAALNTLLGKDDADPSDDVASLEVNLEVTWDAADNDKWLSTETLKIKIDNDVIRGDEETPTLLPTPETWLDDRAVRIDKALALTNSQAQQHWENAGLNAYADLNAANAGEAAHNVLFYNTSTNKLQMTTSDS